MFWMSNATELLNFFQVKVETMEKEWEFEGESDLKTMEITDSSNNEPLGTMTVQWNTTDFGNVRNTFFHLNDCFFKAPGDPLLTADMDTCSEALAQLDDVIMHTFQQCVYHLTKV